MYLPKHHEETRLDVLHDLMRAHPLACLVTLGKDGLIANHVPLLLDSTAGEFGTLKGHVARANPVWQEFSTSVESIAIFQGPQAYVSPSWHPSKHEHGKVVPTWNYAVVHAHGFPRVIHDPGWLLDLVTQLSDVHEAGQRLPWKVADAPEDFTNRLIEMIVGIEIPIAKITGKWKVSQNRAASDRLGIATGLASRPNDEARAVAALVQQAMRE